MSREDHPNLILMEQNADPFVGKPAPPFCLPDAGGKEVCLESFRGKWVVLYFYPRDNTPGCTLEAIQFSKALEEFASLGAQVIGVSTDSPESHVKFAERHDLTVLLLSDTDHRVIGAYDAWKPKSFMGKEFLGTERDTFLVDPEGKIVEVWRKVSVKGHAEAVKDALLARKEGKTRR
ncbi:MAG TPA: peroxiredoxin [Methanomicrobiales archaeon]|nr:peroxiredoxin [Methanomicrobiales archaeon]